MVNWLDLPRDLMIKIFHKVGPIEILCKAQRVCSFWQEIAKDPELYRVIDLYNPSKYLDVVGDRFDSFGNFAKLAIHRSLGGLVEFSIESFDAEELLREIVGKAPRLKCLRIANYGLDEDHLIEVFEKLPLLEEVEFILPLFPPYMVKVLEAVGRSCTKLKSFRLNGKILKLEGRWSG